MGELRGLAAAAQSRLDLWATFIGQRGCRTVAEIGVWKGAFAAHILRQCPVVETYWLVDPWRNLEGWNKPFNVSQEEFVRVFDDAMRSTEFASDRRRVLRGTVAEVIDRIEDGSLDFAYIDGDHTLRGITIDLLRVWPKVAPGGCLAGDDFCPSMWQHSGAFEPTMIFPFAVYFAEAMGARITALPFNQFALERAETFEFVDLTGLYGDTNLKAQIDKRPARDALRSLVNRVLRRGTG